jgi:hypothetical protein
VTATRMIDAPGIYHGIPDPVYHRDPVIYGSLSSTEVRAMLQCPAVFRWTKDHRRPDTRAFDRGHAAHARVLGVGMDVDVYPDPDVKDRRTKAVQEWERKVRDAGRVPLLQHEEDAIAAMERELRLDPKAAPLFDPKLGGHAEVTAVAQDPETGVWLRCKVDWLAEAPFLADYKTLTVPPTLANVSAAIARYRYHVQGAHNMRALQLAGWPIDPTLTRYLLVFQWAKPPYLVTTVDLELPAIQRGLDLQARALTRYVECSMFDYWPGYTDHMETIPTVGLPPWADRDDEEDREDVW